MKLAPRVVVVGAGAAGLGCALALTRAGAGVQVIAAAPPRASLVAAGMLGPVSEAALEPKHAHGRAFELGLAGLSRWREEAANLGLSLEFGCRLRHPPKVRERAAALAAAAGWRVEDAADSIWLGDEAILDTAAAVQALCRASGVEPILGQAMGPLWRGQRVSGVRLQDGTLIEADAVVLAPGAWASESWLEAAPSLQRLEPARGCIVAFAGAGLTGPAMWRAPGVYLARQPGGRLLAGASMEFGVREEAPEPGLVEALRGAAIAERPELGLVGWKAEAGVRAMSPDCAPLLGRAAAPGLFLAAGMSRNGWLLSLLAGEIISAYVLEHDISPLHAAFSPDRFAKP